MNSNVLTLLSTEPSQIESARIVNYWRHIHRVLGKIEKIELDIMIHLVYIQWYDAPKSEMPLIGCKSKCPFWNYFPTFPHVHFAINCWESYSLIQSTANLRRKTKKFRSNQILFYLTILWAFDGGVQFSIIYTPGVVDQHGSNFLDQYSALHAPGVVDQQLPDF